MKRTVFSSDGQVIDEVVLAAYGQVADGAVEAVLAANPHLADLPARLPAGVEVTLPDLPAAPTRPRVRLWD